MEHTPTPWFIRDSEDSSAIFIETDGDIVCTVERWVSNSANAAFIVKACNNYEALVEALKTIAVVNLSNSPLKMEIIEQNCNAALEAAGEL